MRKRYVVKDLPPARGDQFIEFAQVVLLAAMHMTLAITVIAFMLCVGWGLGSLLWLVSH